MNIKKISICSILLSLLVLIEALGSILPFIRVYSLAVAGAIIYFLAVSYDFITCFLVYIAAVLLLFIVLPNKQNAVLFAMFFGLYSIIKPFLHNIKNVFVSYLLRLGVMNAILFLGLFVLVIVLGNKNIILKFGNRYNLLIGIFILIQFIFLAYDYGLSFSIKIINKYIKTNLH